MVVLAASVLEKGRDYAVLFSRQFIPMPKVRIESLLQAFPKLLDAASQHTFIETDQVRYVYQSLDEVMLVLVTNKSSDIMEDLETLRLLCSLVTAECGESPSPDAVTRNAFNILFAFDEVVTLGHKESLTVQQVVSFLEMDSHEERLHQINRRAVMQDVERLMRLRAAEIDLRNEMRGKPGYEDDQYDGGLGNGNDYRGFGSATTEEADNPYASLFPELAPAGGSGFGADAGADEDEYARGAGADAATGGGASIGYSGTPAAAVMAAGSGTGASALGGPGSIAAAAVTALRSEQLEREHAEGALLARQQQALAAKRPIKGMSLGGRSKKAADQFLTQLKQEEHFTEAK
jgi:hypothetical protein